MAETKLSKEQFISFLRENNGLYSQTARAIEDQLGISYSRQAVKQRAEKLSKDILDDIAEEGLDVAEAGLLSLAKESNARMDIRLKAIELLLKSKASSRGYGNKMDITSNGKSIAPIDWVK